MLSDRDRAAGNRPRIQGGDRMTIARQTRGLRSPSRGRLQLAQKSEPLMPRSNAASENVLSQVKPRFPGSQLRQASAGDRIAQIGARSGRRAEIRHAVTANIRVSSRSLVNAVIDDELQAQAAQSPALTFGRSSR